MDHEPNEQEPVARVSIVDVDIPFRRMLDIAFHATVAVLGALIGLSVLIAVVSLIVFEAMGR